MSMTTTTLPTLPRSPKARDTQAIAHHHHPMNLETSSASSHPVLSPPPTVRSPASGDHEPPSDNPHRLSLPPRWRNLLPIALRSHARRVPTLGDGTCADAAIMKAVEQSDTLDSLPLSQTFLPGRHRKNTFRELEVGAAVAAWSPDDWVSKVPASLRDDEWNESQRILHKRHDERAGSVRTTEGELELFRDVLTQPSHPVGHAYLHVAAAVLQQGILLLTQDRRLGRAVYQLDDFGTQQYDSSIVLFFGVGPIQHRESRGDGHYDTVCLTSPDGGSEQTVFERDHPLLCALRAAGARYSDPLTVDTEAVLYLCYPAISEVSGEAFVGPLVPDGAPSSGAPSVFGATGTRPRRERIPSLRLRDPPGDESGPRVGLPSSRSTVACSLRPALDRAAAEVPTSVRASSRGGNRVPREPSAVRDTVLAAARAEPSARPSVLGASAQRNLREWVRQRSRSGRLAYKVHFTAIPMWTARCRTVLLALAAALQETPRMNELKVITLLCVLWMLPQEMFTVPGRSRGGKQGRRSRHHRIHHMLNDDGLLSRLAARVERGAPPDQVRDAGAAPGECGEASMPGDSFASMVDDVEFSDDGQGQDGAAVAGISAADSAEGCAHPMDPRVARRVEHLFRLGHQQRAMRVLKSTTGMADLDQEHERSTLSGLHPAGPSALPPNPSDAPQLIVDPPPCLDGERDAAQRHGCSGGCFGVGFQLCCCAGERCALRHCHGRARKPHRQRQAAGDCSRPAQHLSARVPREAGQW